MKRAELFFSALLVPVDYLMVVAAGVSAYALRFGGTVTGIRPVFYELPLASFFPLLLMTAAGFVGIFALSGLYAVRGTKRFLDEATGIFLGCSTSIMALIVLFFFQREFFSSRFIMLSGWVLAVVYVAAGRLIVRTIQHSLLRRKIGVYHAVIIGQDSTTEKLTELMQTHPRLGYHVVARFPEVHEAAFRELEERFQHEPIDIIFQADPTLPKAWTLRLIEFTNDHHITFRYAADLFEAQASNIIVETLAGIPVIEIKRTKLDGWGRILKRVFDLVVSLVCLVIASPVLLLIPLLIKADTPGPVLVKLKRVGETGKLFHVYKFRSMVQNAEVLKQQLMQYNERKGPLFKMKNDPRITRIGRFLRKTSIDELPQLFNVLRGEMSLVGPRPHEPQEVANYERQHRKLLAIKPGITGLAQISGRSDLDFNDEARLDIFYIENWSLVLDLSILLKTPAVVLKMRSAA